MEKTAEREFGIGRVPADVDAAQEAVAELEAQKIAAANVVGQRDFAPAGTTSGRRVAEGTRCGSCGRPADGYNPNVGQNLCARCWDEY